MGVTLVQFQEILIFPIDFNDFTSNSSHLAIDLGSFGGHFGVIFGTLEPLCGTWEPLGVTLDPLWGTWGSLSDIFDLEIM